MVRILLYAQMNAKSLVMQPSANCESSSLGLDSGLFVFPLHVGTALCRSSCRASLWKWNCHSCVPFRRVMTRLILNLVFNLVLNLVLRGILLEIPS